jgi:predicted RNA-binding protein with RPS1 domain
MFATTDIFQYKLIYWKKYNIFYEFPGNQSCICFISSVKCNFVKIKNFIRYFMGNMLNYRPPIKNVRNPN